MGMQQIGRRAALIFLLLSAPLLAACESAGQLGGATLSSAPAAGQQGERPGYVLGTGDKVRVIVFGEEQLTGEFVVDATGSVSLPLIGQTPASGLTPQQFAQSVTERLKAGYVRDPKVSVEVVSFRPFYIIGEVTKAGEYGYKSGLNVMGAIALAGGYSYRANQRTVYIRRNGEPEEKSYPASTSVLVYPGDVIRIPERYF